MEERHNPPPIYPFPEIRPVPWSFPSALTGSPPRRASAEVNAKLRRRSERGGLSSDGMLCWSPCCAQVGVLLLKGGWPWSARQFAPDAKGLSQAVWRASSDSYKSRRSQPVASVDVSGNAFLWWEWLVYFQKMHLPFKDSDWLQTHGTKRSTVLFCACAQVVERWYWYIPCYALFCSALRCLGFDIWCVFLLMHPGWLRCCILWSRTVVMCMIPVRSLNQVIYGTVLYFAWIVCRWIFWSVWSADHQLT
jgi:hypothetical protein